MSIQKPEPQTDVQQSAGPLVVSFATIDRTALPLVGGKGANLGELSGAGLPVPPGFCVTTAAYALVAGGTDLGPTLTALQGTPADDTACLAALAAAAREHLLTAPVPEQVAGAIVTAYQAFGDGEAVPVAVRSSATAEDLPDASFAGQQDTYLNIVGAEAVLDAVRRCWASLWTDRAVAYRTSNRIDHRSVRLAVVVQRMVDAAVAGVLFTANPLTGQRRQAVIDASPGLGEAVVSGAVTPDHFVVETASGAIRERRLGDKRIAVQAVSGGGTRRVERDDQSNVACLSDAQLRDLARLGAQVEAHYQMPMDTEWAIDTSGQLWLTQARPITTLFPLPEGAPATDEDLRVYFSFNVAQGVYRPFTPMGLAMFRLMASSVGAFLGLPPRDLLVGPTIFTEAAHRIFLDITPALRSTFGHRLLGRVFGMMEARSAASLGQLAADVRLTPRPTPSWPLVRTLLVLLVRSRAPLVILRALLRPAAARARIEQLGAELRMAGALPATASSSERLTMVEQLFLKETARGLSNIVPVFGVGLFCFTLAGKLLEGLASAEERQTVLRGLPHNLTTEMDLRLWTIAQRVRSDPEAARHLRETAPEQLAEAYRVGTLPTVLQQELANFLQNYGHRAVAEIDLGLPRWSEDPTHLLGVLANYLQLTNPDLAPDVQFRRGADAAEEMVADLTQRALRRGLLRGLLVGFFLRRARALAGLRESPKFFFVALLARARALLWPVGAELVRAGRIEKTEDIFFITLAEAHAALAGQDLRALIRERRASYTRELDRRHVPRILLSDGSESTPEAPAAHAAGALSGTPASAGLVTAKARVIRDPTGARLEPGEILVAPSTDPGWTPLFLTAGGLVMEMGGPMSHGAIVAREYGIPAVVGVAGATEHITSGQAITVDGFSGTVAFAD